MDYGVAVTNKFQLFDISDDEDPYEILKQKEEEAQKKKGDKTKKDAKNEKSKTAAKTKKTKAPAAVENKPKGTDQNANKKDGECENCAIMRSVKFDSCQSQHVMLVIKMGKIWFSTKN